MPPAIFRIRMLTSTSSASGGTSAGARGEEEHVLEACRISHLQETWMSMMSDSPFLPARTPLLVNPMSQLPLLTALLLFIAANAAPLPVRGAELELSETLQLPECHSLGWVRANAGVKGQSGGELILDEATWGKPAPGQIVEQHWDWKLTDEEWRAAVAQKGEGKKEEVKFDLWLPEEIGVARGIVVISGHGSGEGLYRHPELRRIARELHLGLFKFIGNPVQRGFWPRSLLYERLADFGRKSRHPELAHAPLFLYGHSNGTGFSAIFPATEG